MATWVRRGFRPPRRGSYPPSSTQMPVPRRALLPLSLLFALLPLSYAFPPPRSPLASARLVVDTPFAPAPPANFRTARSLAERCAVVPGCDASGLSDLRMSASAQPNGGGLAWLADNIGNDAKALFVVDLRQEPHALLSTETPVNHSSHHLPNEPCGPGTGCAAGLTWDAENNWLSSGLSRMAALRFEEHLIKRLSEARVGREFEVKVKHGGAAALVASKVQTEYSFLSSLDRSSASAQRPVGYLRLPVPDHSRPPAQTLDLLADLHRRLQGTGTWLHFHCRAGKGRTTMFSALWDMLSHNVTLEGAAKRVGAWEPGYDLLEVKNGHGADRTRAYEERRAFLGAWDRFARVWRGGYGGSWTEWSKEAKAVGKLRGNRKPKTSATSQAPAGG
ncbi:inositol hexakisphosphate-domain-containing protein [Hyaloraphidium curvatum]|nr:inositol hexakisphosphate-domain-containing protein [Hyaloraphidium curvatum]